MGLLSPIGTGRKVLFPQRSGVFRRTWHHQTSRKAVASPAIWFWKLAHSPLPKLQSNVFSVHLSNPEPIIFPLCFLVMSQKQEVSDKNPWRTTEEEYLNVFWCEEKKKNRHWRLPLVEKKFCAWTLNGLCQSFVRHCSALWLRGLMLLLAPTRSFRLE